jgi:hypothetical protein
MTIVSWIALPRGQAELSRDAGAYASSLLAGAAHVPASSRMFSHEAFPRETTTDPERRGLFSTRIYSVEDQQDGLPGLIDGCRTEAVGRRSESLMDDLPGGELS